MFCDDSAEICRTRKTKLQKLPIALTGSNINCDYKINAVKLVNQLTKITLQQIAFRCYGYLTQ